MSVLIRSHVDGTSLLQTIEREIRAAHPDLAVVDAVTLDEQKATAVAYGGGRASSGSGSRSVIGSLLYGVRTYDPATMLVAAADQYRQEVRSAPGGAVLRARSTNFGMNIWW